MSESPRATVIVTSRDRWRQAPATLSTLLDRTDDRHRVIVVDGGAPRSVSRAFGRVAATGRIDVIRRQRFLATNEARRIALDTGVSDEWIAFVENDSTPSDGWLDTLIDVARDTGAATTFPVYVWQHEGRLAIHGAGVDLELVDHPDGRRIVDGTEHWNEPWPESAGLIRDEPTPQAEPHCLVIRRDVLERMDGPDPELRGWFEHVDLALHHLDLGVECRRVTGVTCLYEPAVRLDPRELSTFLHRWGSDWYEASKRHLVRRWDLDPDDPKWDQHATYLRDVRREQMFPGRHRTNHAIERVLAPIEHLNTRRWHRLQRREAN
jgi:GT2 family glycosyltransferase